MLPMPYANYIVNDLHRITGSATAQQFPDIKAKLVRFKALSTNVASFFIGESANDLHWQIQASYDTDWIPLIDSLSELWFSSQSGTMDKLSVWIRR